MAISKKLLGSDTLTKIAMGRCVPPEEIVVVINNIRKMKARTKRGGKTHSALGVLEDFLEGEKVLCEIAEDFGEEFGRVFASIPPDKRKEFLAAGRAVAERLRKKKK